MRTLLHLLMYALGVSAVVFWLALVGGLAWGLGYKLICWF